MNILNISGIEIAGIVACLPENIIDNKADCEKLFTKETLETVIKATGIKKKAIVDAGTTALDLGVTAAKDLMNNTNTSPEEIGAVICVTFTPEHLMPADALAAQYRLGLPNTTLAFDINMACSGYGYGLYIASTLVKALNKKVLLLDGDIQSAYTSKMDKSTYPVLADVGTATLLTLGNNKEDWLFSFYSDGSRIDKLMIPAGGSKYPTTIADLDYNIYEDDNKRRKIDIYMDGFEIFKFVAQDASRFIKQFMEKINHSAEEFDAFIPHQANIYMIEQLGKKLKFKPKDIWKSAGEYGNPGSASIPLTIARNANEWFSDGKGEKILLSGFGGGLSISTAKINLNKKGYYKLVQKEKGE